MTSALRILQYLLLALTLVFGAATLWVKTTNCPFRPLPSVSERFRPTLFAVNSIDGAMAYLPAYYSSPNPSRRELVAAVDGFVRDRFFHGFSEYRPCDNWIAALAGTLWYNLKVPVDPDDILKYRRAICSQQAIVAEAMLQRLHIPFASVTFEHPGHFVPAAQIDGIWYYFDPDQEADAIVPLARARSGDTLQRLYPGELGRALSRAAHNGEMGFRGMNRLPGPRGALFDRVTFFFSLYGWAVFGMLLLLVQLARQELVLRRAGVDRSSALRRSKVPLPAE
jgi:hypothetical protein